MDGQIQCYVTPIIYVDPNSGDGGGGDPPPDCSDFMSRIDGETEIWTDESHAGIWFQKSDWINCGGIDPSAATETEWIAWSPPWDGSKTFHILYDPGDGPDAYSCYRVA